MEFKHIPVMLKETINGLRILPDGYYFDLTAGGGSHSDEIAKHLTSGRLIAMDRDPDAIAAATQRLQPYSTAKTVMAVSGDIQRVAAEENISGADGILMDLGVSSFQLDNAERGFSYLNDGPLDMRMEKDGTSAEQLINESEYGKLVKILRDYGEERFAPSIARGIIKAREKERITTTGQLAQIVAANIPAKYRREKNPCKRTFQALRIAVNNELGILDETLDKSFELLNPSGRMAIITFHSLEDKLVQRHYKEWLRGCTCPPGFPVCICGNTPKVKTVSKLILPSADEIEQNRRSKSAKLRIIEKL